MWLNSATLNDVKIYPLIWLGVHWKSFLHSDIINDIKLELIGIHKWWVICAGKEKGTADLISRSFCKNTCWHVTVCYCSLFSFALLKEVVWYLSNCSTFQISTKRGKGDQKWVKSNTRCSCNLPQSTWYGMVIWSKVIIG